MRRRTLLGSLPALALVGSAGCSALQRPDVRLDSGSGRLHPTTDDVIANGLQPGGDANLFVTAAPDEAPDLLGPDAEGAIADALRNAGLDQFHVVVQLRSTPAAPMELWPEHGDAFDWPDRSTLRASVVVEPWGSIDRIDDDEERKAFREADDLLFTAVWSLTPGLDDIPSEVALRLAAER